MGVQESVCRNLCISILKEIEGFGMNWKQLEETIGENNENDLERNLKGTYGKDIGRN